MTVSIGGHALQDISVCLDSAEECITTRAQQTPDPTRYVAVVHKQVTLNTADQASTILCDSHCFNIFGRQPVLALQAGTEVFGSGRIRIGPAPFSKSFVAASFVLLRVLASLGIPASLAVGAQANAVLRARFGVLGQGQVLVTFAARFSFHVPSIAYARDTASGEHADQPCHADVLLEIANREEEAA